MSQTDLVHQLLIVIIVPPPCDRDRERHWDPQMQHMFIRLQWRAWCTKKYWTISWDFWRNRLDWTHEICSDPTEINQICYYAIFDISCLMTILDLVKLSKLLFCGENHFLSRHLIYLGNKKNFINYLNDFKKEKII